MFVNGIRTLLGNLTTLPRARHKLAMEIKQKNKATELILHTEYIKKAFKNPMYK